MPHDKPRTTALEEELIRRIEEAAVIVGELCLGECDRYKIHRWKIDALETIGKAQHD